MATTLSGIRSKTAPMVPLFAVLLVAACAPQHAAPKQTQSTSPSVTYTYRGDEELVQANEKAMAYCSQYRSTARTARIDTSSDGSKTVVFDCVALAPSVATTQVYNPDYPYVYHTDEDLLGVAQSADRYCSSNGSQRALTTISTDSTGARTITFRCVPR
jgi:hypothetical protein